MYLIKYSNRAAVAKSPVNVSSQNEEVVGRKPRPPVPKRPPVAHKPTIEKLSPTDKPARPSRPKVPPPLPKQPPNVAKRGASSSVNHIPSKPCPQKAIPTSSSSETVQVEVGNYIADSDGFDCKLEIVEDEECSQKHISDNNDCTRLEEETCDNSRSNADSVQSSDTKPSVTVNTNNNEAIENLNSVVDVNNVSKNKPTPPPKIHPKPVPRRRSLLNQTGSSEYLNVDQNNINQKDDEKSEIHALRMPDIFNNLESILTKGIMGNVKEKQEMKDVAAESNVKTSDNDQKELTESPSADERVSAKNVEHTNSDSPVRPPRPKRQETIRLKGRTSLCSEDSFDKSDEKSGTGDVSESRIPTINVQSPPTPQENNTDNIVANSKKPKQTKSGNKNKNKSSSSPKSPTKSSLSKFYVEFEGNEIELQPDRKPHPPKPERRNLSVNRSQSDVSGMQRISYGYTNNVSPILEDEAPIPPKRSSSFRDSAISGHFQFSKIDGNPRSLSKDGHNITVTKERLGRTPPSRQPPKRTKSNAQRPQGPPPLPPPGKVKNQNTSSEQSAIKSSLPTDTAAVVDGYPLATGNYECIDKDEEYTEDGIDIDHDYHEISDTVPKNVLPSRTETPSRPNKKESTPPPELPPRNPGQCQKSQPVINNNDISLPLSNGPDITVDLVSDSTSVTDKSVSDLEPGYLAMSAEKTETQIISRPASEASSGDDPADASGSSDGEMESETPVDKKKKKLYNIAQEIMTSEAVFVKTLNLLNLDLRRSITDATEKEGKDIIPSGVLNKILNHLPQLQTFNEDLLKDLTTRIEEWESNPKVADIFIKKGPFLKMYKTYMKDFSSKTALLDDAIRKFPLFAAALKEFELKFCGGLAVKHHMLKPIQRIPQYRLHLEDFSKNLPANSEERAENDAALKIVIDVAVHANDCMREGDSMQRLLEIQHTLVGVSFEVITPGRQLVKEGQLMKLSRKEMQPRTFFLFTDVMLYTTPLSGSYKINNVLSLVGMKVKQPQFDSYKNEFSIISVQRSFVVAASCPEDRESWLVALTSTIKKVQENRSTFETLRRGEQLKLNYKPEIKLGSEAPVWVADVRVTMCMICTSEFTLTFRRHHCRACGAVVCKDCLNNKAPLKYLKGKVDKVCDNCFTDLERDFREQLATWESKDHTADEEEFKREQDEFDCLRIKFQKIRKSGRFAKLIKRPNRLKEVQANDPEAIISGYLMTLKNKKWRKMWFVLKNHVLYFYKASEDKAAISSVVLLGYDIAMPKENIAGVDPKLLFQISHANQDPFVFQVDSELTKDRWLKAIATVTDLKDATDSNDSTENTEADPSLEQ